MASQSTDSGTAKRADLVPAASGSESDFGRQGTSASQSEGSSGGSHSGRSHLGSSLALSQLPLDHEADSRVVIVPGHGPGIAPSDVMPDEKTVISAAKAAPPMPEMLPLAGAKHASQHLGQTLVGRRLEHYQLEEFVGGGGMGAVFRATDTRLGRIVAVKVLSRDQSSEENVRRFRNEAQSAARLDHRNIARVHYVGEDAGLNFIVFEFIEGINLRELVQQKGPLPLDEALRYTVQVAEALSHASQRDVVHRDIKPSNVLVTPQGQVKLVDMGLARLHQVDSSFDDLTASGVTLGTFDYISPEQARDPRAADVRSDIYSLGCTLYFMLTGKPPFPDGSALQKLLRHNGVDPPDVRLFRPELPPAIGPLLGKMLAKRPVQRQQSADELILDIDRLAREAGLEIGTSASEVTLAAGSTSVWANLAITIAAPVLVLVVALLILEFATRPPIAEERLQLRPSFAAAAENSPAVNDVPSPAGPQVEPAEITPLPEAPGAAAVENTVGRGKSSRNLTKPALNPDSPASLIDDGRGIDGARVDAPRESLQVGPPPDVAATRGAPVASPLPETVPPSAVTPKPSPPKPPAPKVIVRPGFASTPEAGEVDVVSSLSQAIRRAADRGISEIELDFTGESAEHAFEVPTGRTIVRPAAGRRPVLVFRPDSATLAEQRQMIHVLGGTSRLALHDLEIRLELPPESSSGWSLLAIHQGQSLELSNCVLTIIDKGTAGVPVHDQVSFVSLQTRRVTEMMKMDEEMAMLIPTGISLADCFARGEATFLHVPEELPIKVEWDQGLFISSKRFIETNGTTNKPNSFGRIELSLSRLTVAAQQGVYQMRRKSDAPYQLGLEVNSDRSIFTVASGAPLFEFAGMPTVDDISLSFAGTDNCYPREDMIFLRARPSGSGEGTIDYALANRSRWASSERSPDLGVIWQSPPPAELPPHAQLPEHYRLSDTSPHNAGFRPDDLPRPADPATRTLKPVPNVAPEAALDPTPAATPSAGVPTRPEAGKPTSPTAAPSTDAEPDQTPPEEQGPPATSD